MDPKSNFPAKCLGAIFGNLSGKDLLNCSVVCKQWYNVIGTSEQCMKKIKLNLRDMNFSNYANAVQKLPNLKRKWTNVSLSFVDFKTISAFLDFLRSIQSSVRELSIHSGNIKAKGAPDAGTPDLQFPNLKILEISCEHSEDSAFGNKNARFSTSMWKDRRMSQHALNAIRTGLRDNKLLKKLRLPCDSFFNEDISEEIGFKLRELKVSFPGKAQEKQNINLFLKAQKDSLKTLFIGRWLGSDVTKTVLSMPRLKTLTLYQNVDYIEPTEYAERLPQNHSVTRLDVSDIFVNEMTDCLVRACPNAEYVKINMMYQNRRLIHETCKNLKKLDAGEYGDHQVSSEEFNSILAGLDMSKVLRMHIQL